MPNSVEIFQNTLLKLIVRNGPDSDRLSIILSLGELGYTTDTKRLFIGDGITTGGKLVGNVFAGEATNITSLSPASIGDLAFDTDNNNLYRLKVNDGSTLSDWQLIAGTYSADNGSIVISSDNKISVGLLSANNIDPSLVENPIYINPSTNKIALSANIIADTIRPRNATALTLYQSLSVNGVNYNWPATGPTPGQFLGATNSNHDLVWQNLALSAISTKTITVNFPLTATANGVNVTGTAVNPLTANLIIGASPTLSCVNLWARYASNTNSIISHKGIPTVNKTATGHYTFTFASTIGTSNPYATASIIGSNAKFYTARVLNVTDTLCEVQVYAMDNPFLFTDADISLKIEV
jgi:hypothetical protein